jgi:hypothetical protein
MRVDTVSQRAAPTEAAAGGATASVLFDLLWGGLSDVLGAAATATLLRRSKGSLARRTHAVDELRIERAGLEYRYAVPDDWRVPSDAARATFGELVDELRPLLIQLTGAVILRRLDTIPAFGENGIVFSQLKPTDG